MPSAFWKVPDLKAPCLAQVAQLGVVDTGVSKAQAVVIWPGDPPEATALGFGMSSLPEMTCPCLPH